MIEVISNSQSCAGAKAWVSGAMKAASIGGVTAAMAAGVTAVGAYAEARHYVLRRRELWLSDETLPFKEFLKIAAIPTSETSGDSRPRYLAAKRAMRNSDAINAMIKDANHWKEKPKRLRILHLSDLHLLASNRKLLDFTRSLSDYHPDLLIFTGDLISQAAAIDPLQQALAPFAGTPGAFVFGSNDYFAPRWRNPLRYLWRTSNSDRALVTAEREKLRLPTEQLTAGLCELGFTDLNNARTKLKIGDIEISLVGVADPHINRDNFPDSSNSEVSVGNGAGTRTTLSGRPATTPSPINSAPSCASPSLPNATSDLHIGVTHAPYTRVLDQMLADGCRLIFAGHTHGGQVCLPGKRALVTNCDLPPRLASGAFVWPDTAAAPLKDDGLVALYKNWDAGANSNGAIVQVSAGLGTTPFVPLRTFCAPEAILSDVYFSDK